MHMRPTNVNAGPLDEEARVATNENRHHALSRHFTPRGRSGCFLKPTCALQPTAGPGDKSRYPHRIYTSARLALVAVKTLQPQTVRFCSLCGLS